MENLFKVLLKAMVKDDDFWQGSKAKAVNALKGISLVKVREYETWTPRRWFLFVSTAYLDNSVTAPARLSAMKSMAYAFFAGSIPCLATT